MDKPLDWESVFLEMAEATSKRSKDTTKHGAVLVDEYNRVLSVGFNGPPRKMQDCLVDWTRPAKYRTIVHAEANALRFSPRRDLDNCTLYVTGKPCPACVLEAVSRGVGRLFYGGRISKMMDEKEWWWSQEIARLGKMVLKSGYQ